ncbi:MAG TPA: DUF5996 family protein [Gemmatimonadaceae bacterium]|nr:DUF5996 family protein [Gemmatimonadaceae bacterium]
MQLAKAMILPELDLNAWAPTQTTLQRWMQIVGKTRLKFAPMQNHWWQVVLYVTSRGMTTSPIPYEGRTFEVSFDFVNHELVIVTSEGDTRTLPLRSMSVADFYGKYMSTLLSLGIGAKLWPVPVEMMDTIRFPDDHAHDTYDPDAAHRCWQILAFTDRALKDFRGRFVGKCSPSHFWWGGFDLACTRFSGKSAPPHPGGIPNLADYVTRESYSSECISAGWWPGTVGGPVSESAFYAYSYPEPPGCDVARIEPEGAYYHTQMREWILPYEVVRNAPEPEHALLQFLQTTYDAAAQLAKWDRAKLERPPGWVVPRSAPPPVA